MSWQAQALGRLGTGTQREVDLYTKEGRRWLALNSAAWRRRLKHEVDALAAADALEVGLLVAGNVVVADVQLCQRPDGRNNIRGWTGDGLDILVLTCTLGWQQQLPSGPLVLDGISPKACLCQSKIHLCCCH